MHRWRRTPAAAALAALTLRAPKLAVDERNPLNNPGSCCPTKPLIHPHAHPHQASQHSLCEPPNSQLMKVRSTGPDTSMAPPNPFLELPFMRRRFLNLTCAGGKTAGAEEEQRGRVGG